jgi:hypothetical protein
MQYTVGPNLENFITCNFCRFSKYLWFLATPLPALTFLFQGQSFDLSSLPQSIDRAVYHEHSGLKVFLDGSSLKTIAKSIKESCPNASRPRRSKSIIILYKPSHRLMRLVVVDGDIRRKSHKDHSKYTPAFRI